MTLLDDFLQWDDTKLPESWLNQERPFSPALLIGHRGVSIVFFRPPTTTLAAQRVVIVPLTSSAPTYMKTESGTSAQEDLMVIGLADLDVQKGDMFTYESPNGRHNYKVTRVERVLPEMVQAYVEHLS